MSSNWGIKHICVQNLLVMKLREMEGTHDGHSASVGMLDEPAMTQHQLITWYFDYQTAR